MKSTLVKIAAAGVSLATIALAVPFASAATPNWNVSGNYVIAMNYLGTDYAHNVTLAQNGAGNVTGTGTSGAYAWSITSGTVSADTIDFTANYTASADAVTPLTTMHVVGTVAPSGTMSGTWSDNYQGGVRSGTFSTMSGAASSTGTLAAEDFGVVNYDTGLGQLKGYSAGFGLSGATFAGATSVVVKLYGAGDQLLQTDTAIFPKFATITGTQISAPFDVSGNFNYATDGYWTNVRASEYGQSVPATKVVATVTLAGGKVVTATNTTVAGDPTTIYPTVLPGVLAAEDFGVVSYDTGLGMLKGYTAGFGVASNTLAGATSVVVKLYSGATLLQTNTAILSKFNADITGTQFSSPFDVSGNFNYATDGYWTNVRQSQYGQSVPATRVVATVTLANGKVVTAENTTLTGTPSTIYPSVTPPTTTPTDKNQCKSDGWMTMKDSSGNSFKNQGQCVSSVASKK